MGHSEEPPSLCRQDEWLLMAAGSLTILNQEKQQVWRCHMTISESWALDSMPRTIFLQLLGVFRAQQGVLGEAACVHDAVLHHLLLLLRCSETANWLWEQQRGI